MSTNPARGPRRLAAVVATATAVVLVAGAVPAQAAVEGHGSSTGQASRCAAAESSAVIGATSPCAPSVCAWDPADPSCRAG